MSPSWSSYCIPAPCGAFQLDGDKRGQDRNHIQSCTKDGHKEHTPCAFLVEGNTVCSSRWESVCIRVKCRNSLLETKELYLHLSSSVSSLCRPLTSAEPLLTCEGSISESKKNILKVVKDNPKSEINVLKLYLISRRGERSFLNCHGPGYPSGFSCFLSPVWVSPWSTPHTLDSSWVYSPVAHHPHATDEQSQPFLRHKWTAIHRWNVDLHRQWNPGSSLVDVSCFSLQLPSVTVRFPCVQVVVPFVVSLECGERESFPLQPWACTWMFGLAITWIFPQINPVHLCALWFPLVCK